MWPGTNIAGSCFLGACFKLLLLRGFMLAWDGFMRLFLSQLLLQAKNLRDPTWNTPNLVKMIVVHLLSGWSCGGFTFSMHYASHDNLLIQIMIQYFTFGSFLLLLVVSGTYSNLLIRIILKIKFIKSVKECLLNAPWCMYGSIHRSLDTDCQHRSECQ